MNTRKGCAIAVLTACLATAGRLQAETKIFSNMTKNDVTIFLVPKSGSACKIQVVPQRSLSVSIDHDFSAYAIIAMGDGGEGSLNKHILTTEDKIDDFKSFSWDGKFLLGVN